MRRTNLVWAAILVVCVVGTIYEIPNVVTSARQHANILIHRDRDPELLIPDRVVARDPEAGDILRYGVKWRHSEHARADLRKLLAEYPDNAFLRTAWAEALTRREHGTTAGVLPIVDRLQSEDPDNAYYQYLKGWALLRTPGGEQRLPEALEAFALGHTLPDFYDPYRLYKDRVDLLAEKAGLQTHRRPRFTPFYAGLSDVVRNAGRWESVGPESLNDLITTVMRVADRAIEDAYDKASLDASVWLVSRIEEFRLRELDLSEPEAWQARLRLSQAIATEDLRWRLSSWLTEPGFMSMMPWIMLTVLLINPLGRQLLRKKPTGDRANAITRGAFADGLIMLVAVVVFLLSYQMRPTRFRAHFLMEMPWLMIVFLWLDYARDLSKVGPAGPALIDSCSKSAPIVFGLFAVNGLLLLLIGNTAFMWSRSFAGWFDRIGVFMVWLVFCLLLWAAFQNRRAVLGQIPYTCAVTFVVCWAGFLLAFDLVGARWHYESRACAEPLSVYGPLPTVTEDTYNRVIRDGGPPRYRRDNPYALPEHVHYFAPGDMEAFLERRRAEGKPLARWQIRDLLNDSARDLRPVIRRALAESDATADSQSDSG